MMSFQSTCAIITLLLVASPSPADVVERAEATELRLHDGTSRARVMRDQDGHVSSLDLNGMKLTPDDLRELSTLAHLRKLVLANTNVVDDDLMYLKQCRHLIHLNLTNTDVTDRAIDTILELKELKSLCLGNVKISSQAIEKLRERNKQLNPRSELRWGYYQRKL